MSYWVFLLIYFGCLGLYELVKVLRRRQADKAAKNTDLKAAQAPPPAVPPAPPPSPEPFAGVPEAPTLLVRLAELAKDFEDIGARGAHPRELVDNPEFREASALLVDADLALDEVLSYARNADWGIACAALCALRQRDDGQEALGDVLAEIPKLAPWPLYFAVTYLAELRSRPPVGAALVGAQERWATVPLVPALFRDYFVRRAALGDTPDFGNTLHGQGVSPIPIIKAFLERIDHPFATALLSKLDMPDQSNIDHAFLTSFGRFWAEESKQQSLIEPQDWKTPLATAQATLSAPFRSLLVSGDQLVGKTSFLRLLAKRLNAFNWQVFEASGADLMAGQIWFGQLEGRVRQVVDEIKVGKRLIWYVPDLLQLARSGTHQGQSASILDQILPAIAAGRLVIWTEASPSETARLLQMRPALRGLFEVIRLEPQSETDTSALVRSVVGRLSEELGRKIDAECASVAIASARQYLSASSFPGSALLLIRLAASRSDKQGTTITGADVLKTLAQLTGLPVSILDGKERLDLAVIRAFFIGRVIGQDEAVAAVIDRIAMLKAGLSDPARPIGVFLFAGPTGTGKTELAKTTAEYLFGSIERMIRLDMSEFQTANSMIKILGDGGSDGDCLIGRVRKQPFSVVLLDEFEKAHPRIWDLFLQVFDDGRLTDAIGQVADFRHCLIILTTNLGATTHQSAGLGFAPVPDAFTSEQVLRAIAQTYRPEFQNRLDRVIVFRPLTRELMRVILRKELSRVLERRGLKDRQWAIEWEASALEFLLERGFSPEMGARPLKRAIEQYVIAPLAATIVERRFPEGDQFVFFRSDGRAIQAEFVDPDLDPNDAGAPGFSEGDAAARPATLASMILAPRGSAAEFAALGAQAAAIAQTLASPAWDERKLKLAGEMSAPDFWDRPARYDTLARFALMDRVAAAAGTVEALRNRLARGSNHPGHYSRELVSRLAQQLYLVNGGIRDVDDGAAIEVALMIEPALDGNAADGSATAAWCQELRNMYRAWADRRHMQTSELTGKEQGQAPLLLISGFGAERVLRGECGLHVLERSESRATARVRLAVTPLGDVPPARLPGELAKAFAAAAKSSTVVRRYRREPAPLVRNGDGSWRSGRLDEVLRGDFDLIAAEEQAS